MHCEFTKNTSLPYQPTRNDPRLFHHDQNTKTGNNLNRRHGQSLANVAGIISSDPKISTIEHGLSTTGVQQAQNAAQAFTTSLQTTLNTPPRRVAIYSSDFLRAKETAQIMADACLASGVELYKGNVMLETRLRERYFGEWNGGSDEFYQMVWDVDQTDPNHVESGVESVNSVLSRTTQLILDIEDEFRALEPHTCILVAHGDVLQIMQTGFQKIDCSKHRSLPHLETATLRELKLG
mmetsp:Transcript_15604/g.15796  ORF Transcript_15604/g.15796 Transcript_15604/m.15796 type:complete len:237 (-) Transcript_15604:496-1206(-)